MGGEAFPSPDNKDEEAVLAESAAELWPQKHLGEFLVAKTLLIAVIFTILV